MKAIVFGAGGTIGNAVANTLSQAHYEVIRASRNNPEHPVDFTDRESLRQFFRKVGEVDAVAIAAGEVAFAPFGSITAAHWAESFASKLLGQIQVVEEATPFVRDGGSFTLISGILSDEPIRGGVVASTVGRALEGFAHAAARELPRGIRINVVSPTVLRESLSVYGSFFPGFAPTTAADVATAYQKSVMGIATGETFRLH